MPPDDPYAWLNCTGFESVPVRDRPIHIGRSKESNFVLPHESVSRKHAIVAFHKGKFRIKNLSPMGLTLNGRDIDGLQDLVVGDLIRIGPFVLRVDDHRAQDEDDATLPFGLQQNALSDGPNASPPRTARPDAPTRGLKRPRPPTGRRPPPGGSRPPRPRPRGPRSPG